MDACDKTILTQLSNMAWRIRKTGFDDDCGRWMVDNSLELERLCEHLTNPLKRYRETPDDDVAQELGPHTSGPNLAAASSSTHDPVNRPSHYTSHPSGIECIKVTRHMLFNPGNAIKYIWRNGLKSSDTAIQDLRKAIWYLNDEIERLEAAGTTAQAARGAGPLGEYNWVKLNIID